MKNKSGSKIAGVFKRIINLRSWSDWDRMKSFTLYLWNGFKQFFVPQEAKTTESFKEAQERLNLTDSDILIQQKGLLRLSVIMVVAACLLFLYAMYNLYQSYLLSFVLSLIVMSIAWILAFRYHFWYFQIKKRKLGCTVQEWFKQGLMGDK